MKILYRILIFILILSFSSSLFSQNTLVFFGSFNWEKHKKGIYVYQLDTKTGNLKKKSTFSGVLNPSFLTVSPSGKYLFACTESKTKNAGSVSSFVIDSEKGKLNFINSQRSGGENPVYLSVHRNEKWLVNGNYTEGSISVYPISESGFISPFVQNIHFEEGSVNADRQDRSHIHSTVFSPNFDYVFAPDLGSDKVRIFKFNEENVKPLQSSNQPFMQSTLRSGPRHFTFHPNGNFAYCIEEMGGSITTYQYKNGELTEIQKINTHPMELKDNFESSDIHISPDGRFLYASNRGNENNLAIFSIQENGRLNLEGYQPTLGKHPRIFGIDESGKFVIVTNTGTNDVFVFQRDFHTGILKKVGKRVKIKNVSSVVIKEYK